MTMIAIGDKARDSISGFEGIAMARTQWLHGCARITLQPTALHEGKPVEMQTFDEGQLELVEAGWWMRMRMKPEPASASAEQPAPEPGGPRPEPRRPAAPR